MPPDWIMARWERDGCRFAKTQPPVWRPSVAASPGFAHDSCRGIVDVEALFPAGLLEEQWQAESCFGQWQWSCYPRRRAEASRWPRPTTTGNLKALLPSIAAAVSSGGWRKGCS